MMANVAFKLEYSGFTRDQVEALTEFMSSGVATKEDIFRLESRIDRLEGKMDAQNARLEGKFTLLCRMFGVIVAGVAALIVKAIAFA